MQILVWWNSMIFLDTIKSTCNQPDNCIFPVLWSVPLCLCPPPLDTVLLLFFPSVHGIHLPDLPSILWLDPVLPRSSPVFSNKGHCDLWDQQDSLRSLFTSSLRLGSFHHVSVAATPAWDLHESCLSGDFHSTHPMVSVTLYSVVRSNGELMVICSADALSPPLGGVVFLTDWCSMLEATHQPQSQQTWSPQHGSCLSMGSLAC